MIIATNYHSISYIGVTSERKLIVPPIGDHTLIKGLLCAHGIRIKKANFIKRYQILKRIKINYRIDPTLS